MASLQDKYKQSQAKNQALMRQLKQYDSQLRQAEKKSKKAEKFVGVDKLINKIIKDLNNIKIENLSVSDVRNVNFALDKLTEIQDKLS